MAVPKISLEKLEDIFSELEGIPYGLGAKAQGSSYKGKHYNKKSTGKLSTPVETIEHLDCSGFIRYVLFNVTDGKVTVPEYSQSQRVWCDEQGLTKVSREEYRAMKTISDKKLLIAFIRPHFYGCGAVGHVWFVSNYDADSSPDTMESHSGVGVTTRNFHSKTLRNQVYCAYELPIGGDEKEGTSPRLILARLKSEDGETFVYDRIESAEHRKGKFWVAPSAIAKFLGQKSTDKEVQPLSDILEGWGLTWNVVSKHSEDVDNPRIYVFVFDE